MERKELLAVARGERPASTVFRNGRVANVFSGGIEEVDVAVEAGLVVGVGAGYEAVEEVDLDGRTLTPGFIDAHVHIESSLASPPEFARAVVPRGTTTVVSDPHEIANVHGLEGIGYMLEASEGLPLSIFVMASSCVPATPMGTAGAELNAEDLEPLRQHPRVLGLAEVMNFPGVIQGEDAVWRKLERFRGRVVDGHAPGVRGSALNAYALGGPASDHECTTIEEADEKLRRGLFVFVREATNARNLDDLIPLVTPANSRRIALCTDDRQPPDLLEEGGIDHMLRRIVRAGVDPMEALRLATLNPAEYFGLHNRGAIAPGRRADLVVVSSLEEMRVEEVWAAGRPVGRDGAATAWGDLPDPPSPPAPSMHLPSPPLDLTIPADGGRVRVIRALPDQIVTAAEVVEPTIREGKVVADPERDLLKIAVVERHRGTGRIGLGLVTGLALREGAIGGTVAHDHHNLMLAGVDDASMETAARALEESDGGLVATRGDEVLALLPLPIGGLMAPDPIETIRERLEDVLAAARSLGSSLHDPFMALSFLGLEVIPSLKITDQGLVDVEAFAPVSLWVEEGAAGSGGGWTS